MIYYKLNSSNPTSQYIQINIDFEPTNEIEKIQLPSWRPGRYELGNFAKNVKGFKVTDESGKELEFTKITKDCWEVKVNSSNTVHIYYEYYANELNAGSTYLSEEQLYVNPVNCLAYIVGREKEAIDIELIIPSDYVIAGSLPIKGTTLTAENFDELADSPFICSNTLQHDTYSVDDVIFHLWFQGEVKIDWKRVLADFESFTKKQIEKFGSFPVEEYHYLIHITPNRTYHGVEHFRSTVIQLGPSHSVFNEFYSDLLGVCSHELYHTWNVKSIRPIEMYPYNFTKENYSNLGYLCEGVTTYMGDLFLLKSHVFSLDEYIKELSTQIQKHIDNGGRFNYSVAQSSFDTWLDGYVPGAPQRKVSIYTEGCLISFMLDVMIIVNSEGNHSLDNVMTELYTDYYMKGKGVSESNYKTTLEKYTQTSLDTFYEDYIYGKRDFLPLLSETLKLIGFDLKFKPTGKASQDILGIKTIPQNNNLVIKSILSNSAAANSSLMLEDEIIALNRFETNLELDKWLNHFTKKELVLLVKRKGKYVDINITNSKSNAFQEVLISQIKNPNLEQQSFFTKWSN
ncbi:MAG: M61 family metallopeptidase [Crocinitomicaceae bacterium]|nr:M61 family metallopeptidase [Crocinitomicaceae bacterium]